MANFLARLTAFDWVKIALYGTAVCGAITVTLLSTILKPWGVSDADILTIEARIGSVSAVFACVGFIANTLKNPSPPKGTAPLLTTNADAPTVDTITTNVAATKATAPAPPG